MVLYIIGWHCSYQRLWALQDSGRCRIWGGGVACRIDTRMAAAMEDMNLPFPSTYLAAFYIYVIPSSAHVSRHMGKVPLLWRLAFRAIAPPPMEPSKTHPHLRIQESCAVALCPGYEHGEDARGSNPTGGLASPVGFRKLLFSELPGFASQSVASSIMLSASWPSRRSLVRHRAQGLLHHPDPGAGIPSLVRRARRRGKKRRPAPRFPIAYRRLKRGRPTMACTIPR